MIEIKVSQGAKPGHGGILPGRQGHRGDRRGPARARRARTSSPRPTTRRSRRRWRWWRSSRSCASCRGGKPVGFKICIGDPREFMAIVKAMIQTGIYADFIVVDGGEGGTGRRAAGVLGLARCAAATRA